MGGNGNSRAAVGDSGDSEGTGYVLYITVTIQQRRMIKQQTKEPAHMQGRIRYLQYDQTENKTNKTKPRPDHTDQRRDSTPVGRSERRACRREEDLLAGENDWLVFSGHQRWRPWRLWRDRLLPLLPRSSSTEDLDNQPPSPPSSFSLKLVCSPSLESSTRRFPAWGLERR